MIISIHRTKKVTRITALISEEVALSQSRISEFLSDNASKDKTRLPAPSCPDSEKTSNLSPQVEKVPLLKESVSIEAEGIAKKVWSVVKPNTSSIPPVERQNPSNSLDVSCRQCSLQFFKVTARRNFNVCALFLGIHSELERFLCPKLAEDKQKKRGASPKNGPVFVSEIT